MKKRLKHLIVILITIIALMLFMIAYLEKIFYKNKYLTSRLDKAINVFNNIKYDMKNLTTRNSFKTINTRINYGISNYYNNNNLINIKRGFKSSFFYFSFIFTLNPYI